MYNKGVLGDLTNAQQPNIAPIKPGLLARRKAQQDLFANNAHTSNTCSEKKPSLLERRKKKLTLDESTEDLIKDLDMDYLSEDSSLFFKRLSPECEQKLLKNRATEMLNCFNKEVLDYVEYYKNFEVINPINAFNRLPIDKDRHDPIHWAAINNDLNALSAFISYEVINTVDQRGRNALYFAAACGHVDSIKYLLENHDAKAQLEVLYDDLRHGYQMLIPEILNIDGVKDICGVKDFLSSHKEYNQCLGL
jgi:ankyrin repeat protein